MHTDLKITETAWCHRVKLELERGEWAEVEESIEGENGDGKNLILKIIIIAIIKEKKEKGQEAKAII